MIKASRVTFINRCRIINLTMYSFTSPHCCRWVSLWLLRWSKWFLTQCYCYKSPFLIICFVNNVQYYVLSHRSFWSSSHLSQEITKLQHRTHCNIHVQSKEGIISWAWSRSHTEISTDLSERINDVCVGWVTVVSQLTLYSKGHCRLVAGHWCVAQFSGNGLRAVWEICVRVWLWYFVIKSLELNHCYLASYDTKTPCTLK